MRFNEHGTDILGRPLSPTDWGYIQQLVREDHYPQQIRTVQANDGIVTFYLHPETRPTVRPATANRRYFVAGFAGDHGASHQSCNQCCSRLVFSQTHPLSAGWLRKAWPKTSSTHK